MTNGIFSAIADSTRLSILEMLAAGGELSASEIHNRRILMKQNIDKQNLIITRAFDIPVLYSLKLWFEGIFNF